MSELAPSKPVGISINRPLAEVLAYAANPMNFPAWAGEFCKAARPDGPDWIIETPDGPVKIRFAPANPFGIIDHFVSPAPGVEVYVPMRVVPNGPGAEVILTIFRRPEMSDEAFEADWRMVERDLNSLKTVLESDHSN